MDIAGLSIAMSQHKLQEEVGCSLLKMSMEVSREQVEDLTRMMEQSINPNIGGSIDIRI